MSRAAKHMIITISITPIMMLPAYMVKSYGDHGTTDGMTGSARRQSMTEYSDWLDKKITQIEKKLSTMEKDEAYYSLYDVLEGMLKLAKTCRKQYHEMDGKARPMNGCAPSNQVMKWQSPVAWVAAICGS
jgi:hypothetical protein